MGQWQPTTFQELLRYVMKRLPKATRTAVGAKNAADDAQLSADTAQTTADDAAADAAAAATAASQAKTAADQANTAASGAQSTANGAVTSAASAQAAADNAKTAADNAASAASSAQSTANTAQANADSAAAAAASAANVAGAKADVLIQSATPAASYQKATTLWIDTTNSANTPKRWNGTAWTVVTDKAAVDAAAAAVAAQTAANNAQTTANQAKTDAATAQTAANNAASAASAAQSTAGAAQTAATNAKTAADNAQSTANTAQTNANTAITNAGTAKTAADNAAAAAASAANVAAAKADVLYQSATPDASYQKTATLWVDTTSGANTPKRWNGSAWVAVTDKAATDAAAAASAASTLAGSKADVLIQSATPAASYQKATTLWIDTTSSANTPKRWSGTAWVATTDKAATDAATAAANAATLAGTKADVLIQSTAPAASFQKSTTLWIDTTNGANTPKRWNGTAWTVVTDKAAVDAAAAAAAAQTAANNAQATANQAVSDAAAAQSTANIAKQTADAAQTAATNAQTSANGKNTVRFRTAAPTTSAADKGTADGDIWWVIPNVQTGIVTGQYVWMAANQVWLQQTLNSALLASVDAGKITTGTLTGVTITGVTITGATVTGGTVQTSATGKRVVLANNRVNFYGVDGSTAVSAGVIEGVPNGAGGGLVNIAPTTDAPPFAQFGTRALPVAGSVVMYSDAAWLDSLNVRYLFNVNTGRSIDIDDTDWLYPTVAGNSSDDPFRVRRQGGWVTFGGAATPQSTNQTLANLSANYRPKSEISMWVDRTGTQWRIRIGAGGNIILVGPSGGSGAINFASVTPYIAGNA